MRSQAALPAVFALAALLPVHAQDSREGGPQYKVEIDFRDANGAGAMTDRRYTLLVTDSKKAVLKVGTKSPTASGTVQPQTGGSVVTQFTYLDIGVNIECTVSAAGSRADLRGSLDLSSLAPSEGAANGGGVRNPTVKQTKLDFETTVELGKPAAIATVDDPVTSRNLQVEATVTKAN